jgi:co-chaperonin GroES (HSP10)
MPYMKMHHEIDPIEKITTEIGDLSSIKLFNNEVLVGIYLRPEKTKSGFYLTDNHRDEDKYQSKVGLLLKTGPKAFEPNPEGWFDGEKFKLNDWLVFRPSDGWQITVHGVLCRVLKDVQIKMRVNDPDEVW